MKKKVKRKINPIKIIVFLLIVGLLIILCNHILNINTKNIVILNNDYYSDDEIIETANIYDYPKFLLLNRSKIKNNLKSLDLIEDVKISKKSHYVLEIDVTEKKVLYLVRSENKYKLSDNKNYDLDKNVIVPTLINYVPEDIEKELVKQLSKIDKKSLSLITEIEYSKTDYEHKRFMLNMIDGNIVYITTSKITLLDKYTSIISKVNDKKGILYLDSGNYFEVKEK